MPTRPNDLVIDKKDGVYFTLPSNKPPVVHYIPAGGQPAIVGEVRSPHGIQLSPDEKTLYVGDSAGAYLVSFDVQPDGKLTNKRNLGKYEGVKKTRGRGRRRKPRGRARGRQRGADLRGHAARRPDIQQVRPISRNHSHFAAPAESGIRRSRQEDALSHRRDRMFKVQMLAQGYRGRPPSPLSFSLNVRCQSSQRRSIIDRGAYPPPRSNSDIPIRTSSLRSTPIARAGTPPPAAACRHPYRRHRENAARSSTSPLPRGMQSASIRCQRSSAASAIERLPVQPPWPVSRRGLSHLDRPEIRRAAGKSVVDRGDRPHRRPRPCWSPSD